MGLAAELGTACRLLEPMLAGRRLRGAGVVAGSLDLCLFLEDPPHPRLRTLRIATGGPARARCLLEATRLGKAAWLDGESPRRLAEALGGAELRGLRRLPGERRVEVALVAADGRELTLVAECFGPQGLWFLLDADGLILAESRRPGGKRAGLVPGAPYEAPRAGAAGDEDEVALPADPLAWLEREAGRFAALELEEDVSRRTAALARALDREQRAVAGRVAGLAQRRLAEEGHAEVQREGELLLAGPDPHRKGLDRVEVADWYDEGRSRVIELDPRLDLRQNAQRRFDRARRLRDGAAHTEGLLAEARARVAEVEALRSRLAALEAGAAPDLDALVALEEACGPLLRPSGRKRQAGPRRPVERRPYKAFRSKEGWPILVGRTNADNDRLSMSIARGNDWWLHVGQGVAGSHVVIRAPRDKPPPLETLLDAAHLALHFSKLRGRGEGEVLYTQRKHLRKRKGAPRGAVEVVQAKTIKVRVEPDRLARVLATLAEDDA
ncbi:MAG: NFACT RNA binding domain-containing protein [Planctomycetota bacterium]